MEEEASYALRNLEFILPFNSFVRRLIYYNDQHDHVDDDDHDDEDK